MKNIKKFNTENADSFDSSIDEMYVNPGDVAPTMTPNPLGDFAVKALQVRDQSHIFHWQTYSFAQHEAFGEFYEGYLGELDDLVEMIMGLKGRPAIGNATIQLVDYTPNAITQFCANAKYLFCDMLKTICDENEHEEIFDQARLVLARLDKLQYLLTLR